MRRTTRHPRAAFLAMAALTLAFGARAPFATAGGIEDASAAPATEGVSAIEGQGFIGWLGCAACVGGALASARYGPALSPLFPIACLDICELVL